MRTLILIALLSASCAPIKVHRGARANKVEPEQTFTKTGVVFNFETLGGPVDLREVCPNGWEIVSNDVTSSQGVLRAVTLNLYSPSRVGVSCLAPKPAATEE